MSLYPVIPADAVLHATRRFPKLNWPVQSLAVGEAFIVPLTRGADPDGRSEAYLRVLANKAGTRLGRKFSCRKVDNGLAIARID